MDIKKEVAYLKKHYKTDNPFEIAQEKNILVLYEELGGINGYFNKVLRQKQIHINRNLIWHKQRFTCSHELGHALMHPNANTPFLRASTYLSVDKLEMEANTFAMEFLVSDDDIREYLIEQQYTTEMAARLWGYEKELIELRLKTFR